MIIIADVPYLTKEQKEIAIKICGILKGEFPFGGKDYRKALEYVSVNQKNTYISFHLCKGGIRPSILSYDINFPSGKHCLIVPYIDFIRTFRIPTIDYLTYGK